MTKAMVTVDTAGITRESALNNLVQEWLQFVDVQPTTFVTYQRALKNFMAWTRENEITELNREVAIAYRDNLLAKIAPTTARLYISVLRLFVKFLASKGICPDFTAHFKGVKLDNTVHHRDALSADESKEVFHAMTGNDEKSLRDKAIVGLMLATGLRCVEITRLDVSDIYKRGKKLFLKVHGKARQGKQDSVILPAQCANLINDYLNLRGAESPLFVATSRRNKGSRLQAQTISRMCKRALVSAGYDSSRLTAHSLRHSFSTIAISAGVDIRQVSKALRHKSVVVTEVYLHDLDFMTNTATQTVANLIF